MLFTKMHVLGSDYLICGYQKNKDYSKIAVKALDRILGVGASALIVCDLVKLEMRCYNETGNELSGINPSHLFCFTKYALMHNIKFRKQAFLDILADNQKNEVELICKDPFLARVSIGKPFFSNSMLRINDLIDSYDRQLEVRDLTVQIYSVYLGEVCTVIFVDDFDAKSISYAKEIANHKIFARKTNVGFVKIIDKENAKALLYEPEKGFVTSNSSLVGAIAVVLEKNKKCKKDITIHLKRGSQDVLIRKDNVIIEGSAVVLFECDFKEE